MSGIPDIEVVPTSVLQARVLLQIKERRGMGVSSKINGTRTDMTKRKMELTTGAAEKRSSIMR